MTFHPTPNHSSLSHPGSVQAIPGQTKPSQFYLSYSKISVWKACRMQYRWSYDLKIEPKIVKPVIELGSAIHSALSNFYSHIPTNRTKQILDAVYESSMSESLSKLDSFLGGLEQKQRDDFFKNKEKGQLWLNAYWSKYGIDEDIPAMITEKLFEVDIDGITLTIKPDAIMDKGDGTWVWENKTGNPDIQQLLLEDEQSLYYTFGLRKLGYDCKGVVYNLISNPTRISDGLIREETERTELELAGLGDEIKQIANEINTLPRYPNRGFSCRWCFFRELCRAEWYGGDVQYLMDKDFIRKEQ